MESVRRVKGEFGPSDRGKIFIGNIVIEKWNFLMYKILSSERRLQQRMIRKTRYDFKVVEVSGRGERSKGGRGKQKGSRKR